MDFPAIFLYFSSCFYHGFLPDLQTIGAASSSLLLRLSVESDQLQFLLIRAENVDADGGGWRMRMMEGLVDCTLGERRLNCRKIIKSQNINKIYKNTKIV